MRPFVIPLCTDLAQHDALMCTGAVAIRFIPPIGYASPGLVSVS